MTNRKELLREFLLMNLGTLLVSVGVYFFKFPNHFSMGGVSGLAVLLGKLLPQLSPSTFNTIINVLFLVLGFVMLNRGFGARTVYCSILSAGLIQLISFALLHDVFKIPDYNACYLPSLILSVLWNFTFNRRYTFRSDGNVKRAMLLVALYYVVFITLSRWWSTELVALGVHDWLIEVINMLVNFVTEFLFQKFVVYRGTIDTNELAKKEQS